MSPEVLAGKLAYPGVIAEFRGVFLRGSRDISLVRRVDALIEVKKLPGVKLPEMNVFLSVWG